MLKLIKWTLLTFLGLIVLVIGTWVALSYSRALAYTIVSLECKIYEADTPQNYLTQKEHFDEISYARLNKDWLQGNIVLNWLREEADTETGLGQDIILRESVAEYYGTDYDYPDKFKVYRSFNRETLVYKRDVLDNTSGDSLMWMKRKCKIIPNQEFNKRMKRAADATKAKQKI
jgi:hypothetical protein